MGQGFSDYYMLYIYHKMRILVVALPKLNENQRKDLQTQHFKDVYYLNCLDCDERKCLELIQTLKLDVSEVKLSLNLPCNPLIILAEEF